jgi:HAD superfamily hydrolase (TIGR01490 family)
MQQDDPAVTTHRVAVFDLDGTVTRHDTLVPFLVGWAVRHPRHLWRLWRLPFSLSRFALGLSDRGRLKASLVRQVMKGAERDAVAAWADEFCRTRLPALLNPGALAAIESHRAAGDRLVLLSASVDLYVPAIGRALGFDETICTGLSWSGDALEGRLTTENRRGEEKRRCIEQIRARFPGARITAYGNAMSDFEHLAQADEPLVVNANAATRRRAASLGLACDDWKD